MRATVKVKCFLFDSQVCPSQVLCRGLQLHSCTLETLGGHAQGQWCLGWDCLVHPGANPYVVAHWLGFAQGCAHPLSAHSEWKENRICVQDIRPIEERSLCPCTNFCLCCLALPGFCVPALLCLCGQVQKLGRDHGIKVACPWLHLEVACFWEGMFCPPLLHHSLLGLPCASWGKSICGGPLAWLCPGMCSPIECP